MKIIESKNEPLHPVLDKSQQGGNTKFATRRWSDTGCLSCNPDE